MANSYKFRRGQVWWVANEPNDRSFDTSVQAKSRPYLIVSANINNEHAPIVNACPLSTRPYDNFPCHVECLIGGTKNLIFVEQITTLGTNQFQTYMCTLPDDIMHTVDRKLARQLGVEGITVDKLNRVFEALTKQIKAEIEALQNSPTAIEATVTKQISDLTDTLKDMAETRASTHTPAHASKPTPTPASKPAPTEKPTRTKWTPELMRQYLQEYKTMPLTEFAEKWNISSKATAATNASVFKKKLGL